MAKPYKEIEPILLITGSRKKYQPSFPLFVESLFESQWKKKKYGLGCRGEHSGLETKDLTRLIRDLKKLDSNQERMAGQTVNIESLSLEQLNTIKGQLEEENQILTSSLQQLRVAAGRYQDSKECLKSINKSNEGKTVLIPLTSSLFVPAKLGDVSSVLVDVGTGYYVKKSIPAVNEFTDRKVKIIAENMEKVQQAVAMKRKNLETVIFVMQTKLQQEESGEQSKQITA